MWWVVNVVRSAWFESAKLLHVFLGVPEQGQMGK